MKKIIIMILPAVIAVVIFSTQYTHFYLFEYNTIKSTAMPFLISAIGMGVFIFTYDSKYLSRQPGILSLLYWPLLIVALSILVFGLTAIHMQLYIIDAKGMT